MKKKLFWVIAVSLTIVLFVVSYFLYNHLSEKYKADTNAEQTENIKPQQSEEQKAPDFTVIDVDGKEVNLSDYFGKPIVLNFWASWCPPCKAEMPHFETASLENPDIQFLMVNATSGDTLSSAKGFIEEGGYTFTVLFDTSGEAAVTYNVMSLPTTYFIDKSGNLVTYSVGMLDAESLEKGIGRIL